MVRVTTSGTLKSYRYNLQVSRYNQNKAQNTVLTGRNFNTYSEDPATASRCFQLRNSFEKANSQHSVGQSVVSKYEVAWSTLDSISDIIDTTSGNSSLSAILSGANDATASGRNALGQQLEQTAKSIVSAMNVKYGDNFVFAGADGLKVPFEMLEDGTVTYRGINVDSAGNADFETLKYLEKNEKKFADIGLGMEENGQGDLIETSAYDVALHGITFLGYGTNDGTEDGKPKNIASIIYKMGKLLQEPNCDSNGNFAEGVREEFDDLWKQFEVSAHAFKQKYTELDTEAAFLKSNQKQLENNAYTLQEQFLAMEDVDQADAITAYSWAQYSYNAALKVGNSILSQSLMDYLNT